MSDAAPTPETGEDLIVSDDHDSPSAASAPLPPSTPERPLGDIALSLSGGGYRAAGFHLGVLALLDRVGLLPSVAALSTVSGGSIIGAAWVTSVLDGVGFDAFRERFRAFLLRTNVISEALRHLTRTRKMSSSRLPSLIRSAASIYAAPEFLGDRRFGELYDPRLPLREVIFNSTEFHSGVDFRFRRSDNAQARIGNGNVSIPRDVADRLRLADVVAASSCFPGAFEPLRFPDDFTWPADYPLPKVVEGLGAGFPAPLPLMDGGIYDNQGVESLVLAYERGEAATLLISDTSPRDGDLYCFPPGRRPGWVTVRLVRVLGWLLFVLAAASFPVLAVDAYRSWTGRLADWLLYVVPGLLALATAAGLLWLHHRLGVGAEQLRSEVQVDHVWRDVRGLTVSQVQSLAELRVGSMVALTSSVFMKRIRSLVYKSVFQNPRYEHRRMACLVYGLEESRPRLFDDYPWLRPRPDLVRAAAQAEKMPTTLWFDTPDQLATLERVGQATICFVLLQFILKERTELSQVPGSPIAQLLERLRREWTAMNGGDSTSGLASTPAATPG